MSEQNAETGRMIRVPVTKVGPGDIHSAGTVTARRQSQSGKTVFLTMYGHGGESSELKYSAQSTTFLHARAVTLEWLRKATEGLPGETLIVLSSDAEGNSYAQAVDAEVGVFQPGSPDAVPAPPGGEGAPAIVLYPAI